MTVIICPKRGSQVLNKILGLWLPPWAPRNEQQQSVPYLPAILHVATTYPDTSHFTPSGDTSYSCHPLAHFLIIRMVVVRMVAHSHCACNEPGNDLQLNI